MDFTPVLKHYKKRSVYAVHIAAIDVTRKPAVITRYANVQHNVPETEKTSQLLLRMPGLDDMSSYVLRPPTKSANINVT